MVVPRFVRDSWDDPEHADQPAANLRLRRAAEGGFDLGAVDEGNVLLGGRPGLRREVEAEPAPTPMIATTYSD